MVHGLTNLAKMEDESLDKMDPYQRGAMDISKLSLQFFLQNYFNYLLLRGTAGLNTATVIRQRVEWIVLYDS